MAEVEDHYILLFIDRAILLMKEGQTKVPFTQRGFGGSD